METALPNPAPSTSIFFLLEISFDKKEKAETNGRYAAPSEYIAVAALSCHRPQ